MTPGLDFGDYSAPADDGFGEGFGDVPAPPPAPKVRAVDPAAADEGRQPGDDDVGDVLGGADARDVDAMREDSRRNASRPTEADDAAIGAGRVPPHDLDSEAAVLSSVILRGGEALDDLEGLLAAEDMYSEAHRRIFEAAHELHSTGQPVDVLTVHTWLKDRDRLRQIGGAGYLTDIMDQAPNVNARFIKAYAKRVRNRARLRRLARVLQEATARTYVGVNDSEMDTFFESVESRVQDICAERHVGGLRHIALGISDMRAKMKEAMKSETGQIGISTGFTDLDKEMGGLFEGDLSLIGARPGMGKSQNVNARVLTPFGWRRIGDLVIGDKVTGRDGQPHRVVGVYPQGVREVFRVTMDDGGSTLCSAEHLWTTRTRADRREGRAGAVRELSAIRATLHRADGGANHSLPFIQPARFAPSCPLAVAPWLLGAYLGDGSWGGSNVQFSNPEPDIRARIAIELPKGDELVAQTGSTTDMRVSGADRRGTRLRGLLEDLGLRGKRSHEKSIPKEYLLADVPDRIEMLRGLCDTDGYVTDPRGKSVEFSTTSVALRDGIVFLVGSLGGVTTWRELLGAYTKDGERHAAKTYYRMCLSFPASNIVPVSSAKHLAKWSAEPHRVAERFVRSIEPSGRMDCVCIKIDARDELYVTDDFIVTHNTSYVLKLAENVSERRYGTAIFSLEMPEDQLAQRMCASNGRVDMLNVRRCKLDDGEWSAFTVAGKFLRELDIYVDDTPGISLLELAAKSRRLKAELARKGVKLGLIVIDYLQLMKVRNPDRMAQSIGEISSGLKNLAKELEVPIVALCQLNRGVEGRADRRPVMSDLRESGNLEQDADNIVFLYRDEYYDPATEDKGIVEAIIAKQRNGPTGVAKLGFLKHSTTFTNLEQGRPPEGHYE